MVGLKKYTNFWLFTFYNLNIHTFLFWLKIDISGKRKFCFIFSPQTVS